MFSCAINRKVWRSAPPVLCDTMFFYILNLKHLTNVLDFFAFLALVTEPEAPSRVAADLSAGYLAVAEGFGDDHVLVDAPVCDQT